MPIQVQGPDGSTVEFPDGTSTDTMQSAMAAKFGGPSKPAAAAPVASSSAVPTMSDVQAYAKNQLAKVTADFDSRIQGLPMAAQKIGRDKFFADPRIKNLMDMAAQPVQTRQKAQDGTKILQAQQQSAQQRANQNADGAQSSADAIGLPTSLALMAGPAAPLASQALDSIGAGNFLTGLKAGITRGAFGLPERLAAAGEAYLPSSITGNDTNASYDQILNQVRENTDAEANKSQVGNILGQLISGGLIGGAVGKSVGAAGAGMAASDAPAVANAGRVLNAATQLQKGQTLANAGRISLAGAAAGGAQAAGEGSDPATGALVGAVAAPAVAGVGKGVGKGLGWLGNRAADMLGMRSSGSIIKNLTNATQEELQANLQRAQDSGIQPTLFEILPAADQQRLAKGIVGRSDATREQALGLLQQRSTNMGPEMAARAEDLTAPARQQIESGIADDLANARGAAGSPTPEDAALAAQGSRAAIDMKQQVRKNEADAIMTPVRDQPVANKVAELFPQSPVLNKQTGAVEMKVNDPEAADQIQAAASTLNSRMNPKNPNAAIAGISADDAADIIRKLGKVASSSNDPIQRGAAARAQAHLQGYLNEKFPDVGAAIEDMRSAYAARSRMFEGMKEGEQTRLRSQAPNEGAGQVQRTVNAYDTPEGTQGRVLGQANELQDRFLDTNAESAARNIQNLGQDSRALEANLGPDVAGKLQDTANYQTQVLRSFSKLKSAKAEPDAGVQDLAGAVFALSPSSMIHTKLWAMHKLTNLTRLPEGKASVLVDMLLSQNPNAFAKGYSLISSQGERASQFLRQMAAYTSAAKMAASASKDNYSPDNASVNPVSIAQAAEAPAPEPSTQQEQQPALEPVPANLPYGHAVIAGLFPEAHVTEDIRSPTSKLGRANPGSYHVTSDGAVDVRPIPGMSFDQFLGIIKDKGYNVIEAKNEDEAHGGKKSAWATGNHWHVVLE